MRSIFLILVCILSAIGEFAYASSSVDDEPIRWVPNEIFPAGPAFVKIVTPMTEHMPSVTLAVRGEADVDSGLHDVTITPLKRHHHQGANAVEDWFMLIVPESLQETRVLVRAVVDDHPVGDGQWIAIGRPNEPESKAMALFRDANGFALISAALNRTSITVDASARGKLMTLATEYEDLSYGRCANMLLGYTEFRVLEREFNLRGPPGAYRSCYEDFEAVIASDERDPLYTEAAHYLMIAKAWSSEYNDARELAAAIIVSGISSAATDTAQKALMELGELERVREQLEKAKDVTTRP